MNLRNYGYETQWEPNQYATFETSVGHAIIVLSVHWLIYQFQSYGLCETFQLKQQ